MASGYRLGVDLGTTYAAAAIERDGRVEVCTLGDRTTMIPSLALVRPNGEIVVGEAAARRAASEPAAVAREFKRRLGDPAPLVLNGVSVTPEALMAAVLRHVVQLVGAREDRAPDKVVLSHPASFGPYKTGLMRIVAQLADVPDVELVAEPQAAAISYARRAVIEAGKVVAVYDFGGGTFDAALVRRTPTGGFEIVGQPEGIERLGGIDLDQLLMEHVLDAAGAGGLLDGDVDEATLASLVELRDRCQAAKEALSVDLDARVAVSVGGVSTAVRVTRDELDAMVGPRILETVEALQRAIRNSGLSTGDIDRVLLVGGSSRIPLVADTVRATLHRPVAVDANPKTAICEGAALLLATRPATPTGFAPPPSAAGAGAVALGAAAAGAGLGAAAATHAGAPAAAAPGGGAPAGSGGLAAPSSPVVDAGGRPPPGTPSSADAAGAGGDPTRADLQPIPAAPPPEPRRKRGLIIGAVAAVVVAAIAVAVIALAGGDDATTASTTEPVTTAERAAAPTTGAPVILPATTTAAAETLAPPPTDAPTTTVAASVTQVGKSVYFAGFQIDIATATFTPSEFAGSNGELVLDGVATNLVDDNANIGFIGSNAPITLLVDGLSNSISVTGGDTPPGGRGKIALTAALPSFDPEATVVDFGGTRFNGSTMPLGSAPATTTAPTTQTVTGSGTSSNGLTVTVTDASLQPFSPTANGGGDVTPAAAGALYVGLSVTTSYTGDFDDGILSPLLHRPDGTSISPWDSTTKLIERGEQSKDFLVFEVPSPAAGAYVLEFSPGRGEVDEVVDVPFSLT